MPPLSSSFTNSPISPMVDLSDVPSIDLSRLQLRKESSHSQRSNSSQGSVISFSNSLEVTEQTLSLNDYSPEEKASSWYEPIERSLFKENRREIVKLMESGRNVDKTKHCIRGLEGKTRNAQRRRHFEILNAVNAVLDEQENQFECGSTSPDSIAHIYSMYTRQSQEVARQRAVNDEDEAVVSSIPAST